MIRADSPAHTSLDQTSNHSVAPTPADIIFQLANVVIFDVHLRKCAKQSKTVNPKLDEFSGRNRRTRISSSGSAMWLFMILMEA